VLYFSRTRSWVPSFVLKRSCCESYSLLAAQRLIELFWVPRPAPALNRLGEADPWTPRTPFPRLRYEQENSARTRFLGGRAIGREPVQLRRSDSVGSKWKGLGHVAWAVAEFARIQTRSIPHSEFWRIPATMLVHSAGARSITSPTARWHPASGGPSLDGIDAALRTGGRPRSSTAPSSPPVDLKVLEASDSFVRRHEIADNHDRAFSWTARGLAAFE